jgi:hypothetical protein
LRHHAHAYQQKALLEAKQALPSGAVYLFAGVLELMKNILARGLAYSL